MIDGNIFEAAQRQTTGSIPPARLAKSRAQTIAVSGGGSAHGRGDILHTLLHAVLPDADECLCKESAFLRTCAAEKHSESGVAINHAATKAAAISLWPSRQRQRRSRKQTIIYLYIYVVAIITYDESFGSVSSLRAVAAERAGREKLARFSPGIVCHCGCHSHLIIP